MPKLDLQVLRKLEINSARLLHQVLKASPYLTKSEWLEDGEPEITIVIDKDTAVRVRIVAEEIKPD